MVAKIWIHAGCASGEDVRVEPVLFSKEQSCQYCGVYGKVFLYEKRSERVLVADERGNIISLKDAEGHFKETAGFEDGITEREEGESIPVEKMTLPLDSKSDLIVPVETPIVILEDEKAESIPLHVDVVDEQGEVVDSMDSEIAITVDEEGIVHTDTNETLSKLEQMKTQVAELEHQLEENSTE